MSATKKNRFLRCHGLWFRLVCGGVCAWLLLVCVAVNAAPSPLPATAAVHPAAIADQAAVAPLSPAVPADAHMEDAGFWSALGFWAGLAAAFAAGLALSLTPCVYPMIGITLAIIGARRTSRGKALWLTFLYVLGLSLVYAGAGVAVALLGSSVSQFLRSAWLLVPIGIVFVVMGLSMFDVFSLQTPSGFATRLQQCGQGGSGWGVLLMGALSAFVVGPCVSGPLFSLMLFVAGSGRWVTGFCYLFALAWGMGVLLFVAGGASGLLPTAGAWMERVKHTLGMVLIWAAIYFTRPVVGEAAYQAGTLACIGIWLGVLGLFRLPAPGEWQWRDAARLLLAAALLFACQYRALTHGAPHAVVSSAASTADATSSRSPEGTAPSPEPAAAPNAIVKLDRELAQGRPVILDFWDPWCGACEEIERDTLSQPEVQEKLRAYRLVKVGFDANPELAERFSIPGPPAFVFLNPDGSPSGMTLVTGDGLRRRLMQSTHEPNKESKK